MFVAAQGLPSTCLGGGMGKMGSGKPVAQPLAIVKFKKKRPVFIRLLMAAIAESVYAVQPIFIS
jgi:hypothetical protein